jgi:hypothetical protein
MSIVYSTPSPQKDGIVWLNGTSVYCSNNTFMSYWNIFNYYSDSWFITYSCSTYDGIYSTSLCISKNTGYNDPGNSTTYLDRHSISCGKGMGLVGWNGATNKRNEFRLEYKCCAAIIPIKPTANPTAFPTPLPTISPTAAPSVSTITSDVVTGYICPYSEQLSSGVSFYSMAQTARAVYQDDRTYVVYDE